MSAARRQSSPVERHKQPWFISNSGDAAVCADLGLCPIRDVVLGYAECFFLNFFFKGSLIFQGLIYSDSVSEAA